MTDDNEEMKKYFAALPVPTVPADSIVLRGMFPEVGQYLEKHGCTMVEENEAVTVKYPAGATRTEILPRTMCERFKIVLPDGTVLQESSPPVPDGSYCLWVPEEVLQEDM